MAHALLLSPATRFNDSPDSSNGSGRGASLSPATPPPPSLDFLEDLSALGDETPSRGSRGPSHSTIKEGGGAGLPSNPLPDWLTEELGDDWLSPASSQGQDDAQQTPKQHLLSFVLEEDEDGADASAQHTDGSTTFLAREPLVDTASASPAPSSSTSTVLAPPLTPAPNRFPWQSQPRVPSSLRHGFTAASSPSTSVVSTAVTAEAETTRDMSLASSAAEGAEYASAADEAPSHAGGTLDDAAGVDEGSSAGSVLISSLVDRGSAAANHGNNEQLQAAVRALKGPNAGLFAATDESEDPAANQPTGLLGLFDPPEATTESATPLPKSTRPAPSLSSFTFSPPEQPTRLSPSFATKSTPDGTVQRVSRSDEEATPVARSVPLTTPRQGPAAGPSPTGIAIGKRERFLKRSTTAPMPRAPEEAAESVPSGSVTLPDESSSDADAIYDHRHHAGAGAGATDEDDEESSTSESSSDDDDGDGRVRSAGLGPVGAEQYLLGEAQPGVGWSSDEDEQGYVEEAEVGPTPAHATRTSPHAVRACSPKPSEEPRPAISSLASPPRLPVPESSTSGSARSEGAPALFVPPPSPFRLFQPIYDTVTRSHLAALVDEIDSFEPGHDAESHSNAHEGSERVETSEEGFLGEEGEKRSSKRIRLSPGAGRTLASVAEGAEGSEGEDEEENRSAASLMSRRSGRGRRSSAPTSIARRPPFSRRRRESRQETERILHRAMSHQLTSESIRSPSMRSSLRKSACQGRQHDAVEDSSTKDGVSPPTLPKLAATASASIRSALASSDPPSPSLSHGFPSTLNEQKQGSWDRRQFARTPMSQNRVRPSVTEVKAAGEPAAECEDSSATPRAVPISLTQLHPDASATRRMLASAGVLAREKGLVFDAAHGRWIRVPHVLNTPSTERKIVPEERSLDPFRDLSGTGSSPAKEVEREAVASATTLEPLNGLGISQGSPPLAAVSSHPITKVSPFPIGANAPTGPPSATADTAHASVISQDSARILEPARAPVEPPARSFNGSSQTRAEVSADSFVEASMLKLYRRAHQSTRSSIHDEPAVESTPPCSPRATEDAPETARRESVAQPPRSVLKKARAQSEPLTGALTPIASRTLAALGPPRSVSFSDGKTSGKIEGLHVIGGRVPSSGTGETESRAGTLSELGGGPGSLDFAGFETQSDSDRDGPSSGLASFGGVMPVTASPQAGRSVNRSFTRTRSQNGNATFLTECSFGVSHERLLQLITDVEPFEPKWETLRSIDLSAKKADSVVRLKDFLPNLDEINLNNNEIAYLTGVPAVLRTLLISSNCLSDLTSFQHLARLERLDISNNQLESVRHLSNLRHLRELKADYNRIANLDGLSELDGLIRLSLKGNALTQVDLGATNWIRLESLHMSRNRLARIDGLAHLDSLSTLDLDHNRLHSLAVETPMPRLRVLRLSSNPLEAIEVAFAPKLRTLYIDSARLGEICGTDALRKLENLSVRDQTAGALTLTMQHMRDVKRLYLSGNPLPRSFPSERFFNLVYLELAMCQLSALPENLAAVVPNVRVLNLNHNFIADLSPLNGLARCSRLSLVGMRLMKARPLADALGSMPELEDVDMRMNPLTLPFYPPLVPAADALVPAHAEHQIIYSDSVPSRAEQAGSRPSSTDSTPSWLKLDTKYRRGLPDDWYHRRAAYRAVVVHSVPTLRRLDGIDVTKERSRVSQKLERLVVRTGQEC